MTLFAIVERDLARGDEANQIVVVCKTLETAKRIKKEIEDSRRDGESIEDGLFIEIYEVAYQDE